MNLYQWTYTYEPTQPQIFNTQPSTDVSKCNQNIHYGSKCNQPCTDVSKCNQNIHHGSKCNQPCTDVSKCNQNIHYGINAINHALM